MTAHVLQEMDADGILVDDVLLVLNSGAIIEPGLTADLRLGRMADGRGLHVVTKKQLLGGRTLIITAYWPDPDRWDTTLTRRRQ